MFRKKKANVVAERSHRCEEKLREYAFLKEDKMFSDLDSCKDGITGEQACEKLDEFRENVIITGTEKGIVKRLVEAFINPFNIVLFFVAAVTFVTDVVVAEHNDYATALIIVLLILISSLISFFQSERSNSAAEKLSHMISNKADVLRDGQISEVEMREVVPGDIVRLSAGDMIPGDVRFLTAKDAFVAQAALTGESNPVEKFVEMSEDKSAPLTDLQNIGFMGTNIVSGSAMALILTTGNDTYLGSMAKSLNGSRAKNSFERGVESVSSLLLRFMLVMVPVIFLINGITKGNWASALLFSVTMAVGLIPEMLPMIMTSTLAKGAVNMSKHEVIVKNLSAIQTFGEMDILCTDKTGTLTEDKIVLEKYMDVHGNDDMRILRHAYLNSYFQTGLKNLIDIAIINRAADQGLKPVLDKYVRVDEIPFDFSRRRMSVVLKDPSNKTQLITKGAVEEILGICSHVEYKGQILPLEGELLEEARRIYQKHNREGLRILAVAQKNEIAGISEFSVKDENDMVLLGFVGFLDPPKASAKTAIGALKSHGVRTVVLTGDSEGVAIKVCQKVGLSCEKVLMGQDVESMDDETLKREVADCNLFAKLSPDQKQRLVQTFQNMGHTVGYMGDGINDAPAIRQADVGISVDSGVDIAKEAADMILLKKDLMVLEEGVVEGRRTFGNIMKYIKMAASGNFGNMISVMVASIFLPFLPLLPVHILTQNLLCDFSQIGIPFDAVDREYLQTPHRWDTNSIKWFMLIMGPLSSIFDIACFGVLWWFVGANSVKMAPTFQAGWFIFGTLSQILVVHMIRTSKIPFVQSRASRPLVLSSTIVAVIAMVIVFSPITAGLDFAELPFSYIPWMILLLAAYCLATQLFKNFYKNKFGHWL